MPTLEQLQSHDKTMNELGLDYHGNQKHMNNTHHPYTFTPHDLRIGNVVNRLIPEDGLNSHLIQFDDLGWLTQWPKNFNAIFSPIPITVEMLVDELFCIDGFKIVKEKSCAEKYLLPYQHLSVMFKNSGIIVFCWNDIELKRINYLHELQNLHYDFTREMLTLKSKS